MEYFPAVLAAGVHLDPWMAVARPLCAPLCALQST